MSHSVTLENHGAKCSVPMCCKGWSDERQALWVHVVGGGGRAPEPLHWELSKCPALATATMLFGSASLLFLPCGSKTIMAGFLSGILFWPQD